MCLRAGAPKIWTLLVANLAGSCVFLSVAASTVALADLGLGGSPYHVLLWPGHRLSHFVVVLSVAACASLAFNFCYAALLLSAGAAPCCAAPKALLMEEAARLFRTRALPAPPSLTPPPRVKSERFSYAEGERGGESFSYAEGSKAGEASARRPRRTAFWYSEGEAPVESVVYAQGGKHGDGRRKEFFTFFQE